MSQSAGFVAALLAKVCTRPPQQEPVKGEPGNPVPSADDSIISSAPHSLDVSQDT